MDTKTIISDSLLGQRLENYKRQETHELSYQGKIMPIIGTITVGREKGNNIVLDDKLVSRKHALIQKIKDAYFIKDLNSTNGTYVNNERIPEDKYIKLNKDDVIKFGRTEITIR